MTSIVAWATARPFGPLNPLHHFVLRHAAAPDSACAALLCASFTGLLYLSYLALQHRPNREQRGPVAAAVAAGFTYVWLNYRFLQPSLQPLNCVLTMAFLHLLLKSYELGTCAQIRDSRAFSFPRRVLCAFDLLINLRLFGLGAQLVTPIEAAGSRSSRARPERHLAHLYRLVPPSRLDAVIGHAFDAWWAYAAASLVISALRFAAGAAASSGAHGVWGAAGGAGALGHAGVFLPDGLAMRAHAGWGALAVFCARSFLVPFLAVQLLTALYHVCAAVFVATRLWSIEGWAIDLFSSPGAADSLLNFWSRRWHQVLRHDFLLLASLVEPLVPPLFRVCLPFGASALMHAAMGLNSASPPDPASQLAFFAVHGLGCLIELSYARARGGRRVHGAWGRVWVAAIMALTANVSGGAWVDAGWGAIADWIFPPGATGDKVVLSAVQHVRQYLSRCRWA